MKKITILLIALLIISIGLENCAKAEIEDEWHKLEPAVRIEDLFILN